MNNYYYVTASPLFMIPHLNNWLLVRGLLYLWRRKRSEVYRRYSETLRPVMSTRMSPVTTLVRGGRPPTPLGQEKPVPCMEQMHLTGSWMDKGSVGGDVTISVGAQIHRCTVHH